MGERGERRELSPEHTLELQWETNKYLFHLDAKESGAPTDVDIETVVLDLGNEAGGTPDRTVFVIGGVGEDIEVMKPFLQSMAKQNVQVVGISLPSYGGSSDADKRWREHADGTEKDTFADYSAVLEAVRNRLQTEPTIGARKIQEKVDIVGHSLGGAIMAEYAATHPESVNTVHLVTPGGRKKYDRLPGSPVSLTLLLEVVAMQGKERFGQWLKRLGTTEEAPDVVSHMWIKNFLKRNRSLDILNHVKDDKYTVRALQRFWEGGVTGEGKLDAHIEAMHNSGIRPTVYAAAGDGLFPPASYAGVETVGASVVILDNMEHYAIIDQSERVAKTIRNNMNTTQGV